MKIQLELLDNAYDYLEESLKFYEIADERGEHEKIFCKYSRKTKWKIAFVLLVQSFELIVKECLKNFSPILIYENIDSPIDERSKTVSGSKGIERLCNCMPEFLDQETKAFIKNCIAKRNNFIHYEALIDSSEIKPMYCKLFEIYYKLNKELINRNNFDGLLKKYDSNYEKLLSFAKEYVVFRNQEMKISDKEQFLKEIAINKFQGIYVDENGIEFNRIAYGQEPWFRKEECHEYCPDCLAAIGEFHYELCDIEDCPKCGTQKLSCDCKLTLLYEQRKKKK